MILKGTGVFNGIAIGTAVTLENPETPIFRIALAADQVAPELARLEQAVDVTRTQIEIIQNLAREKGGDPVAHIFDAHLLILNDRMLVPAASDRIRAEAVNAEWALKESVESLRQVFSSLPDSYFRERVGDVEDVYQRLLRNLQAGADDHDFSEVGTDVVVVAHTLSPSDTAQLDTGNVIGIVTDVGGKTSHTAIIAKSLEVPGVLGLHTASHQITTGDRVIVDGAEGLVYVKPPRRVVERYQKRKERRERLTQKYLESVPLPAVSRDATPIHLQANVELLKEVEIARRFGAEGIGLYRSEFLYLQTAPALPTEEDHYRAYRQLVEGMAPGTVVIRTLDLGGEKYFHRVLKAEEANPVLGLRAIRYCLRSRDLFAAQLRGILRASAHGSVKLMFPLVSTVEEVIASLDLLADVKRGLKRDRMPFDHDVAVGVMIEVPSAALAADLLAKHVRFLSVGTNDLIQYCLAIDRGNEEIADLYQPFHPAILRMLSEVVEAGNRAGVPVACCGEMAADPVSAALLIGLGYRELSMDPLSIPPVKAMVRAARLQDLEALAAEARTRETAQAVEACLQTGLAGVLKGVAR